MKEETAIDSLWIRCLHEVREKLEKEGKTELRFEDVDALVLEKAKLPVDSLAAYLKPEGEE